MPGTSKSTVHGIIAFSVLLEVVCGQKDKKLRNTNENKVLRLIFKSSTNLLVKSKKAFLEK